MRWPKLASGLLLSAVATADARRSFQHVGKRNPEPKSTILHDNFAAHYLATRQLPPPKFANENTTKFAVNGTGIPDVDFDIGESYAGYLPITDNPDDTNELFFWFFPSSAPTNETAKEILLWLNGGPGCSSFEGLLQENGPFIWQSGTLKPIPNPWGWNRLTNVVWVEQPIGTGFSRGKVTARGEEDVAAQFLGFWRNFVDTFSLQGFKVYIAGESYAGAYCPYIASAMLDQDDPAYFNVSGMIIYDPVLGDDVVQESATTVPFVDYHHNLFPFNNSFSAHIHDLHRSCGFADYNDKYLAYPPPGPQPPNYSRSVSRECQGLWEDVLTEAISINPCFDVYQVATTCPLLYDVLGFPGTINYLPEGGEIFFDREEVKRAIHADPSTRWAECSEGDVFVNGRDTSDPSTWRVLPHVVDATQNVIIGHGSLDMILLPNGTLLSIQNTTWGGKLGFQSPPVEPFFVPFHSLSTLGEIETETDQTKLGTIAAAGVLGTAHTERGLTYVSIDLSGHMVPQYAPSAAFRHLEFLLGRVDSLSSVKPFTTEPNYPQPPADALGNGTGPGTYSSGPAADARGDVAASANQPGSGVSRIEAGVSAVMMAIGAVAAVTAMNF